MRFSFRELTRHSVNLGLSAICASLGLGLVLQGDAYAGGKCREAAVRGEWAFNVSAQTNAAGEEDASARVARLELRRDGVAIFEQKKYIASNPGLLDGDLWQAEWYLNQDCFGEVLFPQIGNVNIDFILLYAPRTDKLHIAFSQPLESVRADRMRRPDRGDR